MHSHFNHFVFKIVLTSILKSCKTVRISISIMPVYVKQIMMRTFRTHCRIIIMLYDRVLGDPYSNVIMDLIIYEFGPVGLPTFGILLSFLMPLLTVKMSRFKPIKASPVRVLEPWYHIRLIAFFNDVLL